MNKLDIQTTSRVQQPIKQQMRHASKSSHTLAAVPLVVPELPDVIHKSKIIPELRKRLVDSQISENPVSKLTAVGAGGVGKTCTASQIARDATVRGYFKRIGFISVGQTPSILELQKILYQQVSILYPSSCLKLIIRVGSSSPVNQCPHQIVRQ